MVGVDTQESSLGEFGFMLGSLYLLLPQPVRDVDKGVKIFLQQLARIGFKVSPFVVVHEARGGDCGPRRDGTERCHLFFRQRTVDCSEIIVLVFAHQDPRRQWR